MQNSRGKDAIEQGIPTAQNETHIVMLIWFYFLASKMTNNCFYCVILFIQIQIFIVKKSLHKYTNLQAYYNLSF